MKPQTIVFGLLMLMVGIVIGYLGSSPPAAPAVSENGNAEEVADAAAQANGPNVARASTQDFEQVINSTRHFKGDADAPVTIIEFSDFQCPYCQRFAMESGTQIDEIYVETGDVRFGYKHFVFLGEPSIRAAAASECAADQNAFWPYHDHLNADIERNFSDDNLKAIAAELDLDTAQFDQCLDSGKYTSLVLSETQESQTLGVQSTPSFLINGRPIAGAQPFESFQAVIDAELGG